MAYKPSARAWKDIIAAIKALPGPENVYDSGVYRFAHEGPKIGEWLGYKGPLIVAAQAKEVQPDDDAVEYVEKDDPVCTCDIKELTLGQGHSKDCPHYPKEQS